MSIHFANQNKASNIVEDLMGMLAVPKNTHNDSFFHPYLDYQTDFRPKYDSQTNYAELFLKMCAIHGLLNEKLKDEILIKSLLQDSLKVNPEIKYPIKEKILDRHIQTNLDSNILKTRRIRRKKNEIVCFYHVSIIFFTNQLLV